MRISDWSSDVCSSDLQGLGFLMIDGQMTGRPAVIIDSLILFALAGPGSDALIEAFARRALAWQDGFGETQGARNALDSPCRQGVRRARLARRRPPCPTRALRRQYRKSVVQVKGVSLWRPN